ncbi:unnamed protein product [Adineta steineri]|uniref:Uncharacterized protein n=1 Tax=Adineta steineri TaxID=433720 RepID=A0A819FWB6_9BILA|nr:unnamed protein product [Adineta steineri]
MGFAAAAATIGAVIVVLRAFKVVMHVMRKNIFNDIHIFIADYVKILKIINENSSNILTVKLNNEDFFLPATFNNISQRADTLKYHLQRQIKILAQKRRNNISKGIDDDINNQKQFFTFDNNLKIELDQLQNKIVDKNISLMIRYIQVILDSFELYNDIYFLNKTFRLLPILQNIQKQLCCISINIQKILDKNSFGIKQHLRNVQDKLNAYNNEMKNKLDKYISRDIRPPMLVIPCPTNNSSREFFSKINSSNVIDHDLIQTTSVSSEDSLSE